MAWIIFIAGIWARPQWSTLIVFALVFGAMLFAVDRGWLPLAPQAAFGVAGSNSLFAVFAGALGVGAFIVGLRKFSTWNNKRELDALMRHQAKEVKKRQSSGA